VDRGVIRSASDDAVEGIHLPHKMALAKPAMAGLQDMAPIASRSKLTSATWHPSAQPQRGLTIRVAAANHYYVEP
jgi:hypothetical protein